MSEERIYSVTDRLPDNGQIVMCFGHSTFCCKLDMEEEPDWHRVKFQFIVGSYRLKKQVPEDPEESILEYYNFLEQWISEKEDDFPSHILGVTKWKRIKQ